MPLGYSLPASSPGVPFDCFFLLAMTLLLTSDLNGNHHWYDWLVHNADRVDAICVAGDLTDPLGGELQTQRNMAEQAAWRIDGGRAGFFACEGDQDLWGSGWSWLKTLSGTRRKREVAVTSVPWKCQNPTIFDNPHRRVKESGNCWLVLDHEPPAGTAVATGMATGLLGDSLAMPYAPDFILAGHMRSAPWLAGGSWWDRRGKTFLFNAGFDPTGSFPCHILLDTAKREAFWITPAGHERIHLDTFSNHNPPNK